MFVVRKERKEHGLQRWIEGPLLAPGARCMIAEDVVTSGGSTIEAVHRVREEGLVVAGVVSVLDRLAGGADAIGRALRRRDIYRADARSMTSTPIAPTAAASLSGDPPSHPALVVQWIRRPPPKRQIQVRLLAGACADLSWRLRSPSMLASRRPRARGAGSHVARASRRV